MLGIVTVSGLIYNVGMLAGPWFDGQLAQCLYDIVQGEQSASDMYRLCLCYLATILCVQGARYIKRLYVRKFANHVSLTMRAALPESRPDDEGGDCASGYWQSHDEGHR